VYLQTMSHLQVFNRVYTLGQVKVVIYYSSPGERLLAFTTNGLNDNIIYATQPAGCAGFWKGTNRRARPLLQPMTACSLLLEMSERTEMIYPATHSKILRYFIFLF
jgi:hypothetical protein